MTLHVRFRDGGEAPWSGDHEEIEAVLARLGKRRDVEQITATTGTEVTEVELR